MSISPLLSVQHLSKSFGTKHILKDVCFNLMPQESLVIIGGSGTGKSVALKCILGLLKPDGGAIRFQDHPIRLKTKRDLDFVYDHIGMLFQGGALFDSLPVWHNIAFALLNKKAIRRTEAVAFAQEKLQDVGLEADVAFKYPAELSGGMQKRVALARAIAKNPSILFFDEPTAGLDPIMCSVIDQLIRSCVKKLGASAITITHDMRSVRRIADKVGLLYGGQLIWMGSVQEMETTENPYVQQFVNGLLEGPMGK